MAVQGLVVAAQVFSSLSEQGLLSEFETWASSFFQATLLQSLGSVYTGFSVVVHRLGFLHSP